MILFLFLLLLLLLLVIQYLLVLADIVFEFEETSRTNLKKDLIPFYGLYKRFLRQWYKLPE